MDELVQKLEFDGPSISITSRHLSVGVASVHAATFNGTSFSASQGPNTSEPQVPPLRGDRRPPRFRLNRPLALRSTSRGGGLTRSPR